MRPALLAMALLAACDRDAPSVHRLWPSAAPGSEATDGQRERAEAYWVKSIHRPTLTAFRAKKARSRSAAVVIAPGGGHRELVFGPEGLSPARYLARRGLTAFALKYRLAREEGSPYEIQDSRADLARAVRWVRSRAEQFDVDPDRVGVMGFSAGGELASLVSFGPNAGATEAEDPIDRESARPAFHIAIYPGPLGVPETLPENAPPIFLLTAGDDPYAAEPVTRLFGLYRVAGRPVELHFLDRGGHGFNLGGRAPLKAVRGWPERLADWLETRGLVRPRAF